MCTHLGDDRLDPLHAFLNLAAARDVVRVAVRVQAVLQVQAQARDHGQVAVHHLQDRVDQQRLEHSGNIRETFKEHSGNIQ
jgi:hypothetical protein